MLTPEGTGSTVPAAQNPKFVSVTPADSNQGERKRGKNAVDTICSDVSPHEHYTVPKALEK